MSQTILRLPAVMARVGLSRSTIYLRIVQGTFPQPVRLGARAVGWISTEIDEWLRQCLEARDWRDLNKCAKEVASNGL
jgi:prophage regulatory protein